MNRDLAKNWSPHTAEEFTGISGTLVIPGIGLFLCNIPQNPYEFEEVKYDETTKEIKHVLIEMYVDRNGDIFEHDACSPIDYAIGDLKNDLNTFVEIYERIDIDDE